MNLYQLIINKAYIICESYDRVCHECNETEMKRSCNIPARALSARLSYTPVTDTLYTNTVFKLQVLKSTVYL